MHIRALTRLRIGFAFLGVVLLLPLFLLWRAAARRLEQERHLRHEIVAERIFDEMERELTLLLDAERRRPSTAYDAQAAHAQSWAPFVVGYFTRDAQGVHVLAAEQLASGRAQRVDRAVAALPLDAWPSASAAAARPRNDGAEPSTPGGPLDEVKALVPDLGRASKQSEVLNQLNRAAAERLQKQKAEPRARKDLGDQSMGL